MSERQYSDIQDPQDPKSWPNWVVWREEPNKDGKPTKVLYQADVKPGSLKHAASDNPQTWTTYAAANTIDRRRNDIDGIGFVFSEADPFCGIDLDAVFDEEGEIHPWAQEIVAHIASYTELSPSGNGLHIIAMAELPGRGRKKGSHDTGEIGIYDKNRYFTWTNNRPPALPEYPLEERQDEVTQLYNRLFPPPEKRPPAKPSEVRLSTEQVIQKMFKEPGDKVTRLWQADPTLWEGENAEYPSQSEVDIALCRKIAFYTGPNSHEHIEEVFARSEGGRRGKWNDRDDYRWRTIARALAEQREFWSPDPKPKQKASPATPKSRDTRDTTDTRDPTQTIKVPTEAQQFPIHVMPQATQSFIEEQTSAIGCAPDLVGMPVLGVLSAGIGATRSIEIKRGFTEIPSLFLAVVASPGGKKTPAAKPAIKPLLELQKEYKKSFSVRSNEYEERLRQYDVDKSTAKQNKEAAPAPPEPPIMRRTYVSDITLEALVSVLQDNDRGLFVYRDELAGWVRAMDQYKGGGKGSDRQHWLSVHNGDPITVDRKSNGSEPIIVPNPFITLFGGIQPALLGELGGGMEDGLMDRFLFACPERKIIRFSRFEPTRKAEVDYENLYERLTKLEPALDLIGYPVPRPVKMEFAALRAYEDEYNRLAAEMMEPGFHTRLEAQWSKGAGTLARIALIFGICRMVEEKIPEDKSIIVKEDIQRATVLLRYFQNHAKIVYGVLEDLDPVELFAADLKDFLREQPESEWKSTPKELYEQLEARGHAHMPENPDALTKRLISLAQGNPILSVKRSKSGSTRSVSIKLDDPIQPISP